MNEKKHLLDRRTAVDLLCFLAIIIFVAVFWGSKDTSTALDWDETALTLTMPDESVYTIAYDSILRLELVEEPDFGQCLSGEDGASCQYGLWRNDQLGAYVRYTYKTTTPVMQISTAEAAYWIAFDSSETTIAFLDAFAQLLESGGYLTQK